ncbi:hypothetical protein [Aggregatibacter actinomycetemcomitans]|uniref:hypothetical protein n=1 Tax=Aggregatibacter actinomycetemcomitans TaxID=714 RepID=UPI001651CE5B|nr:hypothetical protein [Aggregatibacter actinomycetemcomitans]
MEECEIIAVKTLEKITALLGKVWWDFKLFFDDLLIAPVSTLVLVLDSHKQRRLVPVGA